MPLTKMKYFPLMFSLFTTFPVATIADAVVPAPVHLGMLRVTLPRYKPVFSVAPDPEPLPEIRYRNVLIPPDQEIALPPGEGCLQLITKKGIREKCGIEVKADTLTTEALSLVYFNCNNDVATFDAIKLRGVELHPRMSIYLPPGDYEIDFGIHDRTTLSVGAGKWTCEKLGGFYPFGGGRKSATLFLPPGGHPDRDHCNGIQSSWEKGVFRDLFDASFPFDPKGSLEIGDYEADKAQYSLVLNGFEQLLVLGDSADDYPGLETKHYFVRRLFVENIPIPNVNGSVSHVAGTWQVLRRRPDGQWEAPLENCRKPLETGRSIWLMPGTYKVIVQYLANGFPAIREYVVNL